MYTVLLSERPEIKVECGRLPVPFSELLVSPKNVTLGRKRHQILIGMWATCYSYSHLVHVPLTSILEKGTPLVMVDILIFSSEISFLSFFTSSTVWHLFCITWGLNHTSGWAENFPQFRDQLSYELARVVFPGLVFHTEPSLPGSCSYPRNSFVTNMYLMKCEEFCEYQTTGKLFCFCPPRSQHLTPVPKLQLESDIYLTASKHVSPGIFGGQQSPHVKHDTSGEGGSKELLPCLYIERQRKENCDRTSDPVNSTLICFCTNGKLNLGSLDPKIFN